ncbi:hypothetical protein M7I_7073 [Glarea lozoyensis 74030]|uniref:Uncharacterized protein n=1 Tax=Glarea lozoyensis (strain ATCC 74030 / MF5533) TaxID=1104152 RepID=H0EWB0_GLAL7|nr:hypothetical protein M7I_7073 [Glarea lozoyensis 74030]
MYQITARDMQKLDLSEKTKIYLPSDASYVNQTIQRYTTFQAPTYKVSIKPALAGDVQKISVELVTASGDLVTASKKENVDLFWGIRVEATYLVPDLTNNGKVMNADFLFPVNESTAVFEYFKSLEETLPAELSLILQVGYNINFGGSSVFFIESFPKQAVVAVPNDATAYPHRGTNAHLLFNYGTTDPAIQTKIDDFGKQARNNFSATSGFDGLQESAQTEKDQAAVGSRRIVQLQPAVGEKVSSGFEEALPSQTLVSVWSRAGLQYAYLRLNEGVGIKSNRSFRPVSKIGIEFL